MSYEWIKAREEQSLNLSLKIITIIANIYGALMMYLALCKVLYKWCHLTFTIISFCSYWYNYYILTLQRKTEAQEGACHWMVSSKARPWTCFVTRGITLHPRLFWPVAGLLQRLSPFTVVISKDLFLSTGGCAEEEAVYFCILDRQSRL